MNMTDDEFAVIVAKLERDNRRTRFVAWLVVALIVTGLILVVV